MSEPATADCLTGLLQRQVDRERVPGAVWWVEDERGVRSRGAVGAAVLEPAPAALDEDTPFDLASLTKPLCTALLLVLLEGEQRLDPRQPVGALLEELEGSAFSRASLLALATHTSGLAAWRPLYLRANDMRGYLGAIAQEVPAVAAGESLYSDLGYIVLGAAIERSTGRGLDDLFHERIAVPLGLELTGFPRAGFDLARAAATERGNAYERAMAGDAQGDHAWRTHVLRGEVHDANAHGLGGVAGHAGLFGTAREVAIVAGEMLRPARLPLDGSCRSRLLTPFAGSRERTVGMVAAAHAGAARGILPDDAPGHTGFTGTSLWLDPVAGRCYVLLTNRVHPRVGRADFTPLRRAFHRTALRCSAAPGLPLQ